MIGLLNVGSLVLGLIAWVLPIINLMRSRKQRNWIALTFLSFSSCLLSLFFQIFSINHLVKIGDTSAIMDTSGGIVFASAVVLIVTIILNAITLIVYRNNR